MRKSALWNSVLFKCYFLFLFFNLFKAFVKNGYAAFGYLGSLAVVKINCFARSAQKRTYIRRNQVFPVSYSDNERRAFFCAEKRIRAVCADYSQGVRAVKQFKRFANCLRRRAVIVEFKKPRNNLRVCFAFKGNSAHKKAFLNFLVILNNAVVNNRKMLTALRMRIDFARLSVGCPACVPYAEIARGLSACKLFFKVLYFALCLYNFKTIFI